MLTVVAALTLIIVGSTVEHEYLHKLIFEKHGINSTIEYYFLDSFKESLNELVHFKIDMDISDDIPLGVTIPDKNSTGVCDDNCRLLHTQVEIMDHGVSTIVATLFLLFLLYISYKEIAKPAILKLKEVEEEEKVDGMKVLSEEFKSMTGKEWPLGRSPRI